MLALLLTLIPIALIDSLSVVPVAVVPLALLLGGGRPMRGFFTFVAGIFLSYFPLGILLLFGFDALFEQLGSQFSDWWHQEPDLGEVILEICIGLLLVFFAHRICNGGEKEQAQSPSSMSAWQGFLIAALLIITGIPGALPYFAGIAQILKEDLSPAGMLMALLFYNLVFILPLMVFPLLHLWLGPRAKPWFAALGNWFTDWGKRLAITLFMGLGFLLIVDGIGWLYGKPLILPSAWG